MECNHCGGPTTMYEVPLNLREYVDSEYVATCTRCLASQPAEFGDEPDFSRVSDEFPEGTAGAAMALALGMMDSLALNRSDIEGLLEAVESEGVDPLLVLDRLSSQGNVRLHFDVSRRRHQLEQLL
ncbi:hypothetical protein DM867_12340 [Halosegnis rubeus]|jgi:hypothetical protein|uniref:Small CPxCG-related zinc finger protein n=1 Tax=Halosegnis rubeus TaxID=2212850 RepID=A0A5N5U232_9EURY|nr:DUF6276 family protein [Halosegnis rubeus]KAB7512525.1 hypothetical protein DM867_12340 [Halosegnis rubeus]KAB7514460.1 hypothetical protein DP108_11845 [Halosegnis rubeus]KAB7517850.1 hypothetical protein DMP03_00325 [Halosegnis rubeus]